MGDIEENEAFFANLFTELDPCLKDLSSDMSSLYETKLFSDVTLVSGKMKIECHKAILHAQSSFFANLLDQMKFTENITIDMSNIEWSMLDLVVKYLYSGDLSQMTFTGLQFSSLFDTAEILKLSTLQSFLALQLITEQDSPRCTSYSFNTKFHPFRLSEFELYKHGHSFKSREYISEPKEFGLDQWHLHIKVLQRYSPNYVGVFLVRKPKNCITNLVSIKISLLDAEGNECFPFKGNFIYKNCQKFGTQRFVDKEILSKNHSLYLPNDTLTLVCKLDIAYPTCNANTQRKSVFKICNPESHRLHYFEGFRVLSNNLLSLFNEKVFIDKTFTSSSYVLKVNSCILFGRNEDYISMIEHLFHDLNPEVVESFVKFMYSGNKLFLQGHADIIYDAATRLELTFLINRYSKYLSYLVCERMQFVHSNIILLKR